MKKRKIGLKTLAVILAVVIMAVSLPLSIIAESIISRIPDEETVSETQNIFEIIDKRTETSKTFRLEDGSYYLAEYDKAVHYLDEDGAWQDIDNTLINNSDSIHTKNEKIKFAKKTTGNGELFTLHNGSRKLTLSLDNAKKGVRGYITNNDESDAETELQKQTTLSKINASVTYEDILDDVDIEYIVSGNDIKENIIVKEKKDSYEYTFTLSLNGLTAQKNADGSISINDGYEVVYVIPAPVMWDSAYVESNAVATDLVYEGDEKYKMTVIADSEWMNADERVYPVTIDPPICNNPSSNIIDLDVNTVDTSYNGANSVYLKISTTDRIYWKYSNSISIPEYAYITQAMLEMSPFADNLFEGYIGAYDVTSAWGSDLTWNKRVNNGQGIKASGYTDIQYVKSYDGSSIGYTTNQTKYTWDITPLVKKWISGTNYGLALAAVDGTSFTGVMKFYSNEHGTLTPKLTISYRNMNGIEDYWSYTSQSAGFAGDGHVNNATGNLVFSIPTLTSTDSLMPITPTLIYNSSIGRNYYTNAKSVLGDMGYGFILNLSEVITKKSYIDTYGMTVTYYVWRDGDGTEHAFFESEDTPGQYEDEDGLKLTLEIGSTYTITDTSDSVRTFTKSGTTGYLSSITDKSGNKVSFALNSSFKPTAVKLIPNGNSEEIEQLTFTYSSGKLTEIKNPNSEDRVKITYSAALGFGDFITKIEYLNGTTVLANATYGYDSSTEMLTTVTNGLTNYKLTYVYNSAGRVSEVREDVSNTAGQRVMLEYGSTSTVIRTSGTDDVINNADDLLTTYCFDREGRTVSCYTTDSSRTKLYGASNGQYVEDNEKAKNSIKSAVQTDVDAANYIINGGFDEGNWSWTKTGVVSFSSINQYSYDGNASLTVNSNNRSASLAQSVYLRGGTYTLSAKFRTEHDMSGINITLEVVSMVDGNDHSTRVLLKPDSVNVQENLGVLTFDVPDYSPGRYSVQLRVTGSTQTNTIVKVDEVQLTRTIGVAPFDTLSWGHFDSTDILDNLDTLWVESVNSVADIVPSGVDVFGNVLSLGCETQSPINETSVSYLLFYYDGEENYSDREKKEMYQISAWGKAPDQTQSPSSKFCAKTVITYRDTEGNLLVDTQELAFDKGITDWQFASGSVRIDTSNGCVIKVEIVLDYSGNIGTAYFDNVSFVKGGQVEDYEYNEDGFVEKYQNKDTTKWYKYDDNDNVIQEISSRNVLTDYEYDAKKRLIKETVKKYEGDYNSESDLFEDENGNATTPSKLYHTSYTYNAYGLVTFTSTIDSTGYNELYNFKNYNLGTTSHIFGTLSVEQDNLVNETYYYYDEDNGRLMAIIYPEGNGVTYTYDAMGNITQVLPAQVSASSGYTSVTNSASVEYSYNSTTKRLSYIETDTTVYFFYYDAFGNTTMIEAGMLTLASYTYNANNGKLNTLTYGNGLSVKYVYDELDRIEEIQYNIGTGNAFETVYSYVYDSNGNLHSITDHQNGETTVYVYDSMGRTLHTSVYDTATYESIYSKYIVYDSESKVSLFFEDIEYTVGAADKTQLLYNYGYDGIDRLEFLSVSDGDMLVDISLSYDDFSRTTAKDILYNVNVYNRLRYDYKESNGYQSMLVSQLVSEIERPGATSSTTYNYTYDDNGNITKITNASGVIQYQYHYDELDQLIREDNRPLGKSYMWFYDNAGNITDRLEFNFTTSASLSVTSSIAEVTYSYNAAQLWKDRLTSYNGTAITYDDIGNPITIGGIPLTWEGRQLVEYGTAAAFSYKYTYNADGIRTSKNIDGTVHNYVLDGSRIVSETIGSAYIFIYLYDEAGSPIGIKFRRANYAVGEYDYFFFEKNLQGDIVAIYNESGAKVATYTYDAWGKVTTTYVSTNSIERYVANNNPFRYRGYYYDLETGLYYLQSRYYNPTWGRFLNADASLYNSMLGFNLFAYCVNNPISFVDPTGEWFIIDDIFTGPIDEIIVIGGIALLAFLGSDWAEDALVAAVDAVDAVSELFDSEESDVDEKPNSVEDNRDTSNDDSLNDADKDSRLSGKPGDINKEGYKETKIGPTGKASVERHHTNHGSPKHHSNPHDHDITWTPDGKPKFGPPKNYWNEEIPIFK